MEPEEAEVCPKYILTYATRRGSNIFQDHFALPSLCLMSSGVVINDGDDVPPAWKCESCRQTTLVDGVVPRRAAFLRFALTATSAVACGSWSEICHSVPRRRQLAQLLQIASACLEKLRWFLSMIGSLLVWSVLGTIQTARFRVVLFRLDILTNMAERRALCRRMLRSGLGKRKFIQHHILLISLVEHLPTPRTLIGTDSSVTADLKMVRKDSLESVICLWLHDSDVSCCQVIVSSVFIFVFLIVTTLIVQMKRDYSDRCESSGVLVP